VRERGLTSDRTGELVKIRDVPDGWVEDREAGQGAGPRIGAREKQQARRRAKFGSLIELQSSLYLAVLEQDRFGDVHGVLELMTHSYSM